MLLEKMNNYQNSDKALYMTKSKRMATWFGKPSPSLITVINCKHHTVGLPSDIMNH